MRKKLINIQTIKIFLFLLIIIILLISVYTKSKQTTITYKTKPKEDIKTETEKYELKNNNNIPDKINTEEVDSSIESITKIDKNDFYFVSTLGNFVN
jgi:predicted PurR-regulated permease PerM